MSFRKQFFIFMISDKNCKVRLVEIAHSEELVKIATEKRKK